MKYLVRGGLVLSALSLCVVIIFAQTSADEVLSIANDSHLQFNNSTFQNNLAIENRSEETLTEQTIQIQDPAPKQDPVKENKEQQPAQQADQVIKGKVEKTVSSRAVGASRGKFTVTAYCLRGRTAMGHGVRRGIIAADPRVLPLGSRISIDGSYAGTYLVSDTGGRVKGNKLDIWMPSCSEAKRFGRRSVSVTYLGR